jgi:hypothetical protein
VTLKLVHQLNLHNLFRLTVGGARSSGTTDRAGHRKDGPTTAGDPGRDFEMIISAATLVLTTRNPAILRKYKWILATQSAELRRLE